MLSILLGLSFLLIAVAAFVFLAWLTHKNTQVLRNELDRITMRVNGHLQQTAELTQKTGEGTVRAIGDLYARLGGLEESSQKLFEMRKEIGKLQEVLCAPKTRGGLGELILADLLRQMIPQDHFQLQHSFRSGARVDAVIFVGDYLVPIDSKFPLSSFERLQQPENEEEIKRIRKEFARDVKKHIQDIAARYIAPDEGTLDFALMYIPSENVYYEVVTAKQGPDETSLTEFALSHHVIAVSPNSFYAYLQVILMGLRGLRLDQKAREVVESIIKLRGDLGRIVSDFDTLGGHLNHAQGNFNRIQKNLERLQGKLEVVDQISESVIPESRMDSTQPVETS